MHRCVGQTDCFMTVVIIYMSMFFMIVHQYVIPFDFNLASVTVKHTIARIVYQSNNNNKVFHKF